MAKSPPGQRRPQVGVKREASGATRGDDGRRFGWVGKLGRERGGRSGRVWFAVGWGAGLSGRRLIGARAGGLVGGVRRERCWHVRPITARPAQVRDLDDTS